MAGKFSEKWFPSGVEFFFKGEKNFKFKIFQRLKWEGKGTNIDKEISNIYFKIRSESDFRNFVFDSNRREKKLYRFF